MGTRIAVIWITIKKRSTSSRTFEVGCGCFANVVVKSCRNIRISLKVAVADVLRELRVGKILDKRLSS